MRFKRGVLITGLLIILNFFSVLGEEISLDYPSNVFSDEEFEININLINFSQDIYDVKFKIMNQSKNIAYVYLDNKWKSTYYWIEDVFNISKENNSLSKNFKLKIREYFGINKFEIRIRNSSDFIQEFGEYEINVSLNMSFSENQSEEESNEQDSNVYLEADWDYNIINGKKFEINIYAYNLKNKSYDLKAWIEFEDNVISEIYDEDKEDWKSGFYYINDFFKGPGNKSEEVELRIKEKYSNFKGNAILFFKLRDEKEYQEDIEVLEKEELVKEKVKEKVENKPKIIKLESSKIDNKESENIKSENYIIYESKTELIKRYAIFGFAFLCVLLCILIGWGKLE